MKFRIFVYRNPAASVNPGIMRVDWTQYAENLQFSTLAMGGFGNASLRVRQEFNILQKYISPSAGEASLLSDVIRVIDNSGWVCYEGMIYHMTLHVGSDTISRSLHTLANAVRVQWQIHYANRVATKFTFHSDPASRQQYGICAKRIEIPNALPANSTIPANLAMRYINDKGQPSIVAGKAKGGENVDLYLEVDCVGLYVPALDWRYADSNLKSLVDSAEIVRGMLRPSPNNSMHGTGGWVEQLDSNGQIKFDQQFIQFNASHIPNTNVQIAANTGSGNTRWEIIKQALKYGDAQQRRLLFQVWESSGENRRGIARVRALNESNPHTNNYTGYYDRIANPLHIYDSAHRIIPLWRVRAGDWIVTEDIPISITPPNIWRDPRAFWIEETTYSADTNTLTLSSRDEFNIEQYIGRLIRKQRIIEGEW